MIELIPKTLEGNGVRLEPMAPEHATDLGVASSDGKLWEMWYTSVPGPDTVEAYVKTALEGHKTGHMLPWVVRDVASGKLIGSTRYHDVIAVSDRVEIGYTWYGLSWQRTHVNTACKILLLGYAFDELGCGVVGFRTDNFNFRSQRAIEALGAKKDGVIRHHYRRPDGSMRDTVMYSILATEWPSVRRHLEYRISRSR